MAVYFLGKEEVVGSSPIVSSKMTRSEANVSICLERALTAKTEHDRNWWLKEANTILMSEEQKVPAQPEPKPEPEYPMNGPCC